MLRIINDSVADYAMDDVFLQCLACTTLDGGIGVTSAPVLSAWDCCLASACGLVTRLKPFASGSGEAVGRCQILSCSLVGYALGVSCLSFKWRTTRCSLSFFRRVVAYVTWSPLIRSTVPSSRFTTMVFPFSSSTG